MIDADIQKKYDKIRPVDLQDKDQAESRSLAYYEANLAAFLKDLSNKQIKVLELGPGTGILAKWLRKKGFKNYSSIEACESYARSLKEQGFGCICSPDIPEALENALKGEEFDLVIAIDMLEHVSNDEAIRILEAVHTKMRANGLLLVQVPNVSALYGWNTQASDPTHRAIFNENSLKASFKAAGFNEVDIREVRLPHGLANHMRHFIRSLLFSLHRLLMRTLGAPPVRVMTHLMLGVARKT